VHVSAPVCLTFIGLNVSHKTWMASGGWMTLLCRSRESASCPWHPDASALTITCPRSTITSTTTALWSLLTQKRGH
jgi:hypothetical protein